MRRELDTGAAKHVVEASVGRMATSAVDVIGQALALALALGAANLEDVSEIRVELKRAA